MTYDRTNCVQECGRQAQTRLTQEVTSKHEMRKSDRRIRRTRRLLGEALIRLALEYDYDEISIRRLTQRADVGYATFYRHFKSKDELFIATLISKWNEFKQSLEPGMSRKEEAIALFRYIEKRARRASGWSFDTARSSGDKGST